MMMKSKPSGRDSSGRATPSTVTGNGVEHWLTSLTGHDHRTRKRASSFSSSSNKQLAVSRSQMQSAYSTTGLQKSQVKNIGYASTTQYLRQMAGFVSEKKSHPLAEKTPGSGKPPYKTPEDYYDDIVILKKKMREIEGENSRMKSKIGRLETDNLKKEKEIQQFLDPSKTEDLKRAMHDGKMDSAAVIFSLKQKLLRMEHQVKEKESALSKLQSDLKTTKLEEMKTEMELYMREIQRLRHSGGGEEMTKEILSSGKKEKKMKEIQGMVVKLTEKNSKLLRENRALKDDLKYEDGKHSHRASLISRDYNNLNQKQLLRVISQLEKKMEKMDSGSFILDNDKGRDHGHHDKIKLEGSVAERLEKLDARETELLQENEKQRNTIKKLKEERTLTRKEAQNKEEEIKSLTKEINELYDQFNVSGGRRETTRKESARPMPATRRRSRFSEKDRKLKLQSIRENQAARHIQRGWRNYQDNFRREAAHRQSGAHGRRNQRKSMSRSYEEDESYQKGRGRFSREEYEENDVHDSFGHRDDHQREFRSQGRRRLSPERQNDDYSPGNSRPRHFRGDVPANRNSRYRESYDHSPDSDNSFTRRINDRYRD